MKKYLLILGIILSVVLFERLIAQTDIFNRLELITYDTRSKIALDEKAFGNQFKHADENIVLITIDDYSKNQIATNPQLNLGSWPWRRNIWSKVLNYIEKGKPRAVLFDIMFLGLNENKKNDEEFSNELKKYNNVVLATSLNNPKIEVDKTPEGIKILNSYYLPTSDSLNVEIDDKKLDDAISYCSHSPVPDIYTKNASMAIVNKSMSEDAVIRNSQPIFKLVKDGKSYYMPSLAFAGFLKYMGDDDKIIIKNNKIHYKNRIIPINNKGEIPISWHGTGRNYYFIPISEILLNNTKVIKPSFFKDKIVIIGRTETGTDIHQSAVSPSYAGPESNATALDNFINDSDPQNKASRKFLSKMLPYQAFIVTILSCFFIVFLGIISKNAIICLMNSLWFITLYILSCFWVFADPNIRIWIPMIAPTYYIVMTALIFFAYKSQKELSKRANIMNIFGKFVSPKVLSTLLKNQENLVLKSTKKRITALFCDIKNFTTLSEKCNPEQLVDNLNELFNEIVNIIFDNKGTVDKFIGDCIMAYWGDPIASEDDAFMAVKTALEIKNKLQDLAQKNKKEGKIVFDVKIGINTGEALLGLTGAEKIMSYTAMGDAINVASRLESNCSKLGYDILISKSTFDDIKSKISAIEVGKIKVKGREEYIVVYSPIKIEDTEI